MLTDDTQVGPDQAERIELELSREYSALERETFEYVPRLLALRREVLRSGVHNASTGDWISTLANLLQLMNVGNNVEQMYGWSRFCWTFGGLDTERAMRQLDRMLSAISIAFEGLPRGQGDRVGLLTHLRVRGLALHDLVRCCSELAKADRKWPDRENWKDGSNATH
jgi:hypothetical protein